MNETIVVNLQTNQQALTELTGSINDLNASLESLAPQTSVLDHIASGISSMGEVMGILKPFETQLASLRSVLTKLAMNPIVWAIAAIVAGFALLQQQTGFLTEIMAMLQPVFASLGEVLAPVGDALAQLGAALSEALAPILPIIADLFIGLVAAFLPLMEPLHQLISYLVPVLVTVIKGLTIVLVAIANIIVGVLQVAVALIIGTLNLLVGIVMTVISWFGNMVGAIRDGASRAFNWVSDIFGKIASTIGDAINNAVNFVTSLPGKIMSALSGAGSWLFDIGKNMIEGLINGAKSLLSNIGNFFLDVVPGWIKDPFKAALGIHSPSRVFAGFGGDILRGLANGIESSAYLAERAVDGLAGSLSSDFRAVVDSGAITDTAVASASRQSPVINQYNTNYTEFDQDQALAEFTWLFNRARS